MPTSMAFFRELRAPLVVLAIVALVGALIMPPKVQAALASVLCAPQISINGEDGSSTGSTVAKAHCAMCALVSGLAAEPFVLALGRGEPAAISAQTVGLSDLAIRRVRNRGPPLTV